MQSTGAVREAFLAAAIGADGMGQVPKIELQAGYMAQPGSRRPDDAREDCQEEPNFAVLPVADQADVQSEAISAVWQDGHQVDTKSGSDSQSDSRRSDDACQDCQEESYTAELPVAVKAKHQFDSNSVVPQEGHQADSNVGPDSAARAFLKTPRVGFPRQKNKRAPRVPYPRPLVMSGREVPDNKNSGRRRPAVSVAEDRHSASNFGSAAKAGAGGVQAASQHVSGRDYGRRFSGGSGAGDTS
ncbi:hypothetical protein ZWY2020_035533 [Hordeum vulgare]|nr:hypothetical protein ZWY2020_035533 [Hordeum vulgare]